MTAQMELISSGCRDTHSTTMIKDNRIRFFCWLKKKTRFIFIKQNKVDLNNKLDFVLLAPVAATKVAATAAAGA